MDPHTITILIIVAWAVIFLLLAVGFYLLIRAVGQIDRARINMNHIMADLHSRKEAMVTKAEADRRKYGTTSSDEKKPGLVSRVLEMLNNQLVWSGISIERPWINAAIYLITDLVLALAVFTVGLLAFNIVVGFVLAALAIIMPYAYVLFLANHNYHNTEVALQFFINLVGSNAEMGDLLSVLERSAPYTIDPIRSAILRAVATAEVSGNSKAAIWQLEREIEHPIFRNFIRNLDICSENDADFRSVARDFAQQAEKSISQLEKLRAIFANARNEVILMIAVGVLLSYMTASFCDSNLYTVLQDMTTTPLGMVCIFLECVIYIASFGYILLGRKR